MQHCCPSGPIHMCMYTYIYTHHIHTFFQQCIAVEYTCGSLCRIVHSTIPSVVRVVMFEFLHVCLHRTMCTILCVVNCLHSSWSIRTRTYLVLMLKKTKDHKWCRAKVYGFCVWKRVTTSLLGANRTLTYTYVHCTYTVLV